MTRTQLKTGPTLPMHFVRALLFAVSLVFGFGCTTEAETEIETETETGPVHFEILRNFMSEPEVTRCRFNENTTRDTTHYEAGFDPGLSRLELVIDSRAEFDAYISCDDTVSIDFDDEYVLAGMTRYQPNQIRIREQTVERIRDSIYFRVGISNSPFTSPSRAEYIIKVTSRDYVEYPVIFDVYWENESGIFTSSD